MEGLELDGVTVSLVKVGWGSRGNGNWAWGKLASGARLCVGIKGYS